MKFAYQAGLAIGQHKTAFAVLLVGVIGAGYYLLSIPSPVVAASASPSAAVFDPSQTPGAIARAQAEALRVKTCVDGVESLKQQARESLRAGAPEKAYELLNPCRVGMVDDGAKKLLDEATKASNRKTEAVRLAAEKAEKARRKQAGVSIGMTEEEVLQSSWGVPRKVNKTTRANSFSAQWVYDGGYLYFENGILRTIQH